MLNIAFILIFSLSIFACSRAYVDSCIVPTAMAVGTCYLGFILLLLMGIKRINLNIWTIVFLACTFLFLNMAGGNVISPYVMIAGSMVFFSFVRSNSRRERLSLGQMAMIVPLILSGVALWGILQFVKTGMSLHVTGPFDNSLGFAMSVSMALPFLLYLSKTATALCKRFAVFAMCLVFVALCLSASRAGIIASCLAVILFYYKQTRWANKRLSLRLVYFFVMALFLVGIYVLKMDSANGRLLIWGTAVDMIWQQPWGYGIGGVLREYMNYQADFLKGIDSSYWQGLADNVNRVFCEYLAVGIELGLWAMLLAIGFLVWVIKCVIDTRDDERRTMWLLLFLIGFVSLFSYPLYYPFTWVVLGYAGSCLLPAWGWQRGYAPGFVPRFVGILLLAVAILYQQKTLYYERQWKACAESAWGGDRDVLETTYPRLYPHLRANPLFLYNYGAELYYANDYQKSIAVLTECVQKMADYDTYMLIGYNYYQEDRPEKALEAFQVASSMCPGRLYPLYRQMLIYKQLGKYDLALQMAREIVNKPVKVPSSKADLIKQEARQQLTAVPAMENE